MTSYSALKRKTQRADVTANMSRVRRSASCSARAMPSLLCVVPGQSRARAWIHFDFEFSRQSRPVDHRLRCWVRSSPRSERTSERFRFSSTVVLYDLYTQKQDFIISPARKAITSLSLSPDGRYLATGEVDRPHTLVSTTRRSFFSSAGTIPKCASGICMAIRPLASNWAIINSPSIVW